MYLAAFLFAGGFMINFENLDKFTFPGVEKYDIPQIEPVKAYPQGEFIPVNYPIRLLAMPIIPSLFYECNQLLFVCRQCPCAALIVIIPDVRVFSLELLMAV